MPETPTLKAGHYWYRVHPSLNWDILEVDDRGTVITNDALLPVEDYKGEFKGPLIPPSSTSVDLSLDFDQIAERIAPPPSTMEPGLRSTLVGMIVEHLTMVWNARGAADIALVDAPFEIPLMPETPDFEKIVERLALRTGAFQASLVDVSAELVEQLRQVWNARGAADLAVIDDHIRRSTVDDQIRMSADEVDGLIVVPNAVARAIRTLDR